MLPQAISEFANLPLDFLGGCPIVVNASSSVLELIAKLKQLKRYEHLVGAGLGWLNFDRPTENCPALTHGCVFALVIHKNQLIGIITSRELKQIAELNGNLDQTSVSVVMRRLIRPAKPIQEALSMFAKFPQLWKRLSLFRKDLINPDTPLPLDKPRSLQEVPPSPMLIPTARDVAIDHLYSNYYELLYQPTPILNSPVALLQDIANTSDLFNRTLIWLQDQLQVGRVCVYRYLSNGSLIVQSERVAPGLPAMLGKQFFESLLCSPTAVQTLQAKCYLQISDVSRIAFLQEERNELIAGGLSHLEVSDLELLRSFQVIAKLAIPIFMEKDKLWGVLVAHQTSAPRNWQPTDISALQLGALCLSCGMNHTQLFEQTKRLQYELDIQEQKYNFRSQQNQAFEGTLKRIVDRVRDSLDETDILHRVVQELATVLELNFCQAELCDTCDPSTCATKPISIGFPSAPAVSPFQLQDFPDLCRQVEAGHCSQFCLPETGYKDAILIYPIFDDKGYLGSLRLFAHHSHCFLNREIQLVHHVASNCAIAIRQARLYKEAQQQVHELEKLNQLKDDFLSTVSHELRTPLASIKMVLNLLRLSLPEEKTGHHISYNSNKIQQYLSVMEEECDQEINLVNDLISIQHLKAGTYPLTVVPIQLNHLICYITDSFQNRFALHHQQLALHLSADLPMIHSDSFTLNRILVELLNNACKYTPSGEQITIRSHRHEQGVRLIVSNSGVEIAPDQIQQIFDSFYRIPSNDPWKQGGTGLGLALIKRLVEYLNGTIAAGSWANQVHFYVNLPLTLTPEDKSRIYAG